MGVFFEGWPAGFDAYRAGSWATLGLIGGLLALTLALGFGISRIHAPAAARLLAWVLVFGGFAAMNVLIWNEPGGLRMLALCGLVFYAMKAVVAVEQRGSQGLELGFAPWLLWAACWPGMRPSLFKRLDRTPIDNGREFIIRGLVRLAAGLLLGLGARALWLATGSRLAASVLLLPAISLMLHFGLFNIVAGAFRLVGVRAQTLFPAPLSSRSLIEFWGRRWNLPFTEMIQRALYRPLSGPLGKTRTAFVGFLFSGLLHELAISVPVHAGYGLPMLYFLIHGGLTILERRLKDSGWLLERSRLFAHVWTLGWLALPMPILFHRPFLEGVIWPLIGIPAGR